MRRFKSKHPPHGCILFNVLCTVTSDLPQTCRSLITRQQSQMSPNSTSTAAVVVCCFHKLLQTGSMHLSSRTFRHRSRRRCSNMGCPTRQVQTNIISLRMKCRITNVRASFLVAYVLILPSSVHDSCPQHHLEASISREGTRSCRTPHHAMKFPEPTGGEVKTGLRATFRLRLNSTHVFLFCVDSVCCLQFPSRHHRHFRRVRYQAMVHAASISEPLPSGFKP